MLTGILIGGIVWLYIAGSGLLFLQHVFSGDDEPWYVSWAAILFWPVLFPASLIKEAFVSRIDIAMLLLIVTALGVVIFLSGCAPTYYDDNYYGYGRRYDERVYYSRPRRPYRERVRDGSYWQTEQYGIVDEHGQGWSRCWVHQRPAWCRVD